MADVTHRRDFARARISAASLFLFTLILLSAAVFRFAAFTDVPPGLQHDEMFKAIEGRLLLETGDFRVFYQTNQGHEGGYVWALAASMALLGVNVLAVKFPAFVFGMLTVALTIRFAGKALGRRAAVFAGGLCAVTFFAVFVSRVGLRAVMLPVFVLWLLLALHGLLKSRRYRDGLSAGLALGLCIYTYTSAFALWGGVGALILALLVFDRAALRAVWRPLALTVLVGAVLSLPMIVARATDPEGFNRTSTITRPLTDALAGRPQELLDNGLRLLGMAAFGGDPEARYNVPDRPFYPVPVGYAAYIGLAVLVLQVRRRPVLAALLGVMAAGLVPSLLTVSAPSFLRSIALLPGLMLCVAAVLDKIPGRAGWAVGFAAVALVGAVDGRAYFVDWPQLPEVGAIYRDDLEQLARAVKNSDAKWLVSTPDVENDSLTFSIYAGGDAARVGFFDGDTAVAFADGDYLAVSPLAALTPPHQPFASAAYGMRPASDMNGQNSETAFTVYDVSLTDTARARLDDAGDSAFYLWPDNTFEQGELAGWAASAAYPANFGGLIELTGVELADRVVARDLDGVNLQLFLRPLADRPDLPLSVFVHVYRAANGRLHAQRDLMSMPPSQWMRGVTIVQDNFVVMGRSRPGTYIVAVGIYNVVTGERLPILGADGAVLGDRVLIGQVEVGE